MMLVKTNRYDVAIYNPEKGLRMVAMAEAGEKHFARAKDATKLFKAIEAKIEAQADYVVWRDSVSMPPGKRNAAGSNQHVKRGQITEPKSVLPAADPGDVVAHRWRKSFCVKNGEGTKIDADKLRIALEEAKHRSVRICEQEKDGTVRGTEGTGEFLRYTPKIYVEAARSVMGGIDLDPATSKQAQKIVKARKFYTEKTNGLDKTWMGRVWLNPPYHRDLAPAFINKLIIEIDAQHVDQAIMLTNNCTDTEWFSAAVSKCASMCFTNGRIRFTQPNGKEVLPTQGQTFFYFGKKVSRFEEIFSGFGFCAQPTRQFVGVKHD